MFMVTTIFSSLGENQNFHLKFLKQNERPFRLHYVRDILIQWGSITCTYVTVLGKTWVLVGSYPVCCSFYVPDP